MLIVVVYTGAILVQEEKLQFASKRYPNYFRRAMLQLSAGME